MTTSINLLSILVPVYSNAPHLRELYERVRASLEPTAYEFELVLVDDGSTDQSWSIIDTICRCDPRVRGICLSRNFGQHSAISAALDYARGDAFILMDADLQDPPEEIPTIAGELERGTHDIVYTRKMSDDKSFAHKMSSHLFHFLFGRIAGAPSHRDIGTFRGFSKLVAEALKRHPENNVIYGPLMHSMGFRAEIVDVIRTPRAGNKSSYTFAKRLQLGITALFGYTAIPYQVMMVLGGSVSVVSAVYALAIVVQYFLFDVQLPQGFTMLVLMQIFTLGIVLGALGLIGNYIYLVYREVLGRPRYLIQSALNVSEWDKIK